MQRGKTLRLADCGDDGPTEEESIGQIPPAGEISSASGIHPSLDCINYFLQRNERIEKIPPTLSLEHPSSTYVCIFPGLCLIHSIG